MHFAGRGSAAVSFLVWKGNFFSAAIDERARERTTRGSSKIGFHECSREREREGGGRRRKPEPPRTPLPLSDRGSSNILLGPTNVTRVATNISPSS